MICTAEMAPHQPHNCSECFSFHVYKVGAEDYSLYVLYIRINSSILASNSLSFQGRRRSHTFQCGPDEFAAQLIHSDRLLVQLGFKQKISSQSVF